MLAHAPATLDNARVQRPPKIASERWFFAAPEQTELLSAEDQKHALRVLRTAAGERVGLLDGRGSLLELELVSAQGSRGVWRLTGETWSEPEPGEPGAELPWLSLALSPPKGSRADEMLDRLTQLGVASVQLLVADRTQGFEGAKISERLERWRRIAREACKQAKRLHLPEFVGPDTLERLLAKAPAAVDVLLSPRASDKLADVVASAPRGTRAAPWRLWIGPEGGWSPAEEQRLLAAGARAARIASHVLRVETAAEAAAAIALHTAWVDHSPSRSRSDT